MKMGGGIFGLLPGLGDFEKQANEFVGTLKRDMRQILANQQAIADHFGIDLPTVQDDDHGR